MSEVLSQSEIDALLNALNSGELDVQEIKDEITEKKVRLYDFRRPNKFAKEQLRTLQIIYENYSRLLTTYLSGYLRTFVQIDVLSVDQVSYSEFTNSINNPSILAVVDFQPLPSTVQLYISPSISFSIIDRILGGAGLPVENHRIFTEIELTLIEKILVNASTLMREPWENVIELNPRLDKIETNSQFAQIMSPNETVALITLNMKMGKTEGMINICIPHIALEPILSKLSTKFWFSSTNKEASQEEIKVIEGRIESAKVPINVIIGEAQITIRELLSLQVNDVIQLDTLTSGDIKVIVGSKLKYYGKPGVLKNRNAVKIIKVERKGAEDDE